MPVYAASRVPEGFASPLCCMAIRPSGNATVPLITVDSYQLGLQVCVSPNSTPHDAATVLSVRSSTQYVS
jgi:hypothetical protein